MTERLHFHFSLSCLGEGNGNPLQCSCLENPRDGGAWWAAVCGVAQSRTRLKRLSSSSSIWIVEIQIYSIFEKNPAKEIVCESACQIVNTGYNVCVGVCVCVCVCVYVCIQEEEAAKGKTVLCVDIV